MTTATLHQRSAPRSALAETSAAFAEASQQAAKEWAQRNAIWIAAVLVFGIPSIIAALTVKI